MNSGHIPIMKRAVVVNDAGMKIPDMGSASRFDIRKLCGNVRKKCQAIGAVVSWQETVIDTILQIFRKGSLNVALRPSVPGQKPSSNG